MKKTKKSKKIRIFAMRSKNYRGTEVKSETQKEIGKWFMDIAKYVASATLISHFLGGFENNWVLYCVGVTLVFTCFFAGVLIFNQRKNK